MRYLYTLAEGIKHYRCLRGKKKQTLKHITDLKVDYLHQHAIKCLALDFDGVLNAHAEPALKPEVKQWLEGFVQVWPSSQIVILSNKPKPIRLAYFKTHFPGIGFCTNVAKKPYPQGLLQIAKQQKISPNQIMLVDDRLLTGMLACCISGAQGVLIKHPYKRVFRRPIRELFFASLRVLERLLII